MHTVLGFEVAKCVITFHGHGHRLYAGLIPILNVGDGYFVTLAFTPSDVHTVQHGRPILALGTTGTRVDLEYGSQLVFFQSEHILKLQLFGQVQAVGISGIHLFFGGHFFLVKIKSQL
ncbi:MAG: hypothetical protein BWY72_01050 [Bacteroidetes bacterium ADurb.Bin416]|nr:MAG: hypothetical protein BWY72_01050 [Bacteroidetes bacterium ADurb.Bin416]